MPFLRNISITEISYLKYDIDATPLIDRRHPTLIVKTISIDDLAKHELLQPR